MAGRFVCNLLHFVWSTAGRRQWINSSWEDQLHGYIGGIARNKKATLITAGGMPDHSHLLISVPPTISLSDLVNELKSNSSRWIHREGPHLGQFRWQESYYRNKGLVMLLSGIFAAIGPYGFPAIGAAALLFVVGRGVYKLISKPIRSQLQLRPAAAG